MLACSRTHSNNTTIRTIAARVMNADVRRSCNWIGANEKLEFRKHEGVLQTIMGRPYFGIPMNCNIGITLGDCGGWLSSNFCRLPPIKIQCIMKALHPCHNVPQSLASIKLYSNLAGASSIMIKNIKFDEVKKVLKKWFSNALHGSGWSAILQNKQRTAARPPNSPVP